MQEPFRNAKSTAKPAATNIHHFQPMNVPRLAHEQTDEAAILYSQMVEVTIESMFSQPRVPRFTANNLDRLKEKLRNLLLLAGCFQFDSIQLKLNLNELQFEINAFEFREEGFIRYEHYEKVLPFFNRILNSRNTMEILKSTDKQGQPILALPTLLECFHDEKKQNKFFLLEYHLCFEAIQAGILNIDHLLNANDNVVDNLKMSESYRLVSKGKIRLDRLPFLAPNERLFLNHPVVVDLILEGRLNIDDWRYVNTTPRTNLANLVSHDPRTHEAFVHAIKVQHGEAIERSGVAMRP